MTHPINPADLGEPYKDNAWCVDEQLYPEARGWKTHTFATEAEAKQFLSDNAADYNAQKLPEVSGMGVAVGGEKSNRQAALECLYVAKKNDEWSILYPHFKTLEAALTAKPYIVNLSEEEATALLQDATPCEISCVSIAALTAQQPVVDPE